MNADLHRAAPHDVTVCMLVAPDKELRREQHGKAEPS